MIALIAFKNIVEELKNIRWSAISYQQKIGIFLFFLMLSVPVRQYAQMSIGADIDFIEQCETNDAESESDKKVKKGEAENDDFLKILLSPFAALATTPFTGFLFITTLSQAVNQEFDPPPEFI